MYSNFSYLIKSIWIPEFKIIIRRPKVVKTTAENDKKRISSKVVLAAFCWTRRTSDIPFTDSRVP